MAIYQCIIFHHALFHHASCYIININPMVHMYCVKKGGEIFKMTICIKNFINEHLNVCLLYYTIIVNLSKTISTLKFENT